MAITFPASFQSAISDNAADLAAGFLTPSRHNSGCTVAGLGTNQVLFSTDATTLAQSSSFTFDGTTLKVPDGAAATPAIRVASEASGLFRQSASSLGFAVAGGHRATLWTDGAYYIIGTGTILGMGTTNSPDSGVTRISAGVVGISTGSAGASDGSIRAKHQSSDGTAGFTAISFTTADGKTVTGKDGIITNVV